MALNFKATIKQDFKLDINKLLLIANFLTICLLVGYVSRFVPPVFSSTAFLKIEFVDVFILIAFYFLGIFYTFLLVFLFPWLLMLISGNSGPVAYLALMLSSLGFYSFFLIILLSLLFVMKLTKIKPKKYLKLFMIILSVISASMSAVLNSFWMVFLNWSFILDLYGMSYFKSQLLTLFLPFNLIKFLLQVLLYTSIIPAIIPLIQKYREKNYYILL